MLPLVASILFAQAQANWSIVTDGNPVNRHGAEDVQRYLKESTGMSLPIVAKAKGKRILISTDAKLAEEEYSVRSTKGGLEIRGGGKRGALYGCYGFLQDVLGCRWYTSKISRIPIHKKLDLAHISLHGKPAFEYREPYFTEAWDKDWDVRNRLNGSFMPIDDSVGGKVLFGRLAHTFSEICPPETYFKDHPEYFSLVDGKRRSGYAQLCLTNPEVLKLAIAKVRQWIKENPSATIFSVSQNDTYYNCQCDQCRAIEREEGSPMGPLLRFVNNVADSIAKESPHILIQTLAYQWSEKPPLKERPHKNVRICLAPIGACFTHPMDQCDKNKAPLANLKAWAAITNQLYMWHYCTDFANYLQPLPDLEEIAGDIRLFHNSGAVGVFYEGAYGPGGGGDMAELKSYLIAQLLWNPNQPAQPIIDDFLQGVYGPAAPQIKEWLTSLQQPFTGKTVHATIYDQPSAPYFSPELLAHGEELFDQAENKTASNPEAHEMVEKARMALDFLEFTRRPDSDPAKQIYGRKLAEKIRRFHVGQTSEGRSSADFLKQFGL